jgi:hypothetical protein
MIVNDLVVGFGFLGRGSLCWQRLGDEPESHQTDAAARGWNR